MLITLYGDCQPQARPRLFKRFGRSYVYSPKKGQESYIQQLKLKKPKVPLTGAIDVEIKFYIKRPKSVTEKKRPYPIVKPDLDNLAKGVLDAMNKLFFIDDSQIIKLNLSKEYAVNSKTEVIVNEHKEV